MNYPFHNLQRMIDKKTFYYLVSGILLVLFISPFIYITKYTFLTIDDYCRASLTSNNYLNVIFDWYPNLNGRYFNAIITSLPIFDLFWYRSLLYLQFFLLGAVLFNLIRSILSCYQLPNKNYTAFFLSAGFYIFIIAGAPSLYELFYWYSSVTVYLISFILFIIFLGFIIREHFNQRSNYILIAIVIISLNGNNELFIGLTNFLLLVTLIKRYLHDKVLKIYLIVLNLVSWISSAAVVFAPGSKTRLDHFTYGGNFIGSLKVSLFYGTKFILESFLSFPFIFFYIFLFLFVYRIFKPSNINKFLHPLYLLVISFVSLASIYFILYYATGLFQVREARIGNLVGMVTFIFIAFNILNFAIFLHSKKKYTILNSPLPGALSLLLFLALLLANNKNYVAIQRDLANNSFENYKQEVLQRINYLKTTKEEQLLLEPINGTFLIKSGDVALYLDDQIMTCYKSYVHQNYNSNIKDIEIKKPPQVK